jgi:hypothetical protein
MHFEAEIITGPHTSESEDCIRPYVHRTKINPMFIRSLQLGTPELYCTKSLQLQAYSIQHIHDIKMKVTECPTKFHDLRNWWGCLEQILQRVPSSHLLNLGPHELCNPRVNMVCGLLQAYVRGPFHLYRIKHYWKHSAWCIKMFVLIQMDYSKN